MEVYHCKSFKQEVSQNPLNYSMGISSSQREYLKEYLFFCLFTIYTQLLPKNTCVMKISNNKSQKIICSEKST